MKSILKELYDGNIYPDERSYKCGSEYGQAASSFAEASEKFLSMLDKSQVKAYEDVQAARDKMDYWDLMDRFIYGVRFGFLIAMEVYNMSDDFIVGGI